VVGFSILNSILLRLGTDFGFCVGLFVAQFNDYVAIQHKGDGHTTVLVLSYLIDALLIGGFALAARACDRRRRWVLLAGLICYTLDSALTGVSEAWPNLVFHAITLGFGFRAFSAIGELQRVPPADAPAGEPQLRAPSRGFAGWPAAIVGLLVVGVVLVLVIYVCQEADHFVANR